MQSRVAATLAGFIARETNGRPVGSVLELGCGTGLLTRRLAGLFPAARAQAIDASGRMAARARESCDAAGAAVGFAVARAESFSPGCVFDLVVSSSSLHWVEPLEAAFRNARRLLAPGGLFLFAVMLDGTLGELHLARRRVAPEKVPPGRLPTEREVRAALGTCGFEHRVLARETLVDRYPDGRAMLRGLHDLGLTGGRVSRAGAGLTRGELARLAESYESQHAAPGGGVLVRYEVVYVAARPAAGAEGAGP